MKKIKVNGSIVTNITIKVDSEIRNAIINNHYKLFSGLKRCHIVDSFPFKICFNCQTTCSHMSKECPLKNQTICRYCQLNHFSKDCPVKNDSTKHRCRNCNESKINHIKAAAKSHFTNSNHCPLIKSIKKYQSKYHIFWYKKD